MSKLVFAMAVVTALCLAGCGDKAKEGKSSLNLPPFNLGLPDGGSLGYTPPPPPPLPPAPAPLLILPDMPRKQTEK